MTKYSKLHITYSNNNLNNDIVIDYCLRNNQITEKWVQRVLLAQHLGYHIDDPSRFYGFGSIEKQTNLALNQINQLICKLQNWIKIDFNLHSINDQDTLNKLHHIFELEHGLLDEKNYNIDLKQHLCELNLLVHRCESIARGAHPRHVVTYFGLPKTETLSNEDYNYFEKEVKFGTVYINYAEIGKTLYDLMLDKDTYINPEAFQPFLHFSADFVVKFWNEPNTCLIQDLKNYYNHHQVFFNSLNYTWEYLSRSIGNIPVADLNFNGNILEILESRQFVKAVDFS